ncbi:hypothetical protein L7F22_046084 [Adiantum nelumboides]|nr:hypothetical protein [Adiantum nelumboides]
MEENGIKDQQAVEGFHLIVVPELRMQISMVQPCFGTTWKEFKAAVKADFFLEDSQRVINNTFIKWVQKKDKGLTAPKLLQEFAKKFDQLSKVEQLSLKGEKVELFIQAVDSQFQKQLVKLLEDLMGELGLMDNWKTVTEAIGLLVKCQKQMDKLVVPSLDLLKETKVSKGATLTSKAISTTKVEESMFEQVMKGIQELSLNFKILDTSTNAAPSTTFRPHEE